MWALAPPEVSTPLVPSGVDGGSQVASLAGSSGVAVALWVGMAALLLSHMLAGHFALARYSRGAEAVDGRVHMHDLHATILHLLGINHKKLTYRYAGRDFRLTDVKGRVVKEIFA